jgi:hypothetical protein
MVNMHCVANNERQLEANFKFLLYVSKLLLNYLLIIIYTLNLPNIISKFRITVMLLFTYELYIISRCKNKWRQWPSRLAHWRIPSYLNYCTELKKIRRRVTR